MSFWQRTLMGTDESNPLPKKATSTTTKAAPAVKQEREAPPAAPTSPVAPPPKGGYMHSPGRAPLSPLPRSPVPAAASAHSTSPIYYSPVAARASPSPRSPVASPVDPPSPFYSPSRAPLSPQSPVQSPRTRGPLSPQTLTQRKQEEPPKVNIFLPKQADETPLETVDESPSETPLEPVDESPRETAVTAEHSTEEASSPEQKEEVDVQLSPMSDSWDFEDDEDSQDDNCEPNAIDASFSTTTGLPPILEENEQSDHPVEQQLDEQPAQEVDSKPVLSEQSSNAMVETQQPPVQQPTKESPVEPLTPEANAHEIVTTDMSPLSPKFDFLINESVPLQKLQDSTSKRRHESLTRIHEMDCKLASLQAKLAHESMDRGLAFSGILQETVYQPLEACVGRMGNQLLPPDGPLHSRVFALEVSRMRHAHVAMTDAVAENLESPHEFLEKELEVSLRLETSKADKREGSMVRRFESIAGTIARRHQEEGASRKAALTCLASVAQEAADLDEQRAMDILENIKQLREALRKEREERKAQDKRVMALIVERTTALKRALLEAAGSN